MRYEQICQPHLLLQPDKQIDYLSLYGYIQRGYRFMANYKLRIHCQCAGDADTLALAARKLMREVT